jgi:hypothetical protein
MIYLSVVKNDSGDWVILKTITNVINVRGNKTGNTYGDISALSLDVRRSEGFWTQKDLYVNTGEFMVFKEKTVDFSEQNAEVTNTYIYELMPLDDIRNDLLGRVDSKRDGLYYAGFTFQDKQFYSGLANRSNIQLMLLNSIVDEANFPSDLVWDTVDGEQIPMDLATFRAFAKQLADTTRELFITARSIKAAINAATTYEDLRSAASWNGEAL